ncbi:phage repressor protein CI [Salmonella enterica]|uniref:Phage repressor protein n=1 Tax=Salmonella enterica TaxID=28901 RepID=A0A749BA85_SALER|nr:phage repressor protein CI [Salmonella enterica]EBY3256332.1 phage repressor protein [Salmonella enterica subsp. enterica serovar Sundsvall]EBY3330781.1 phage repressor protein [Salmonella enterica subsp. enterica serovar Sundsvall]EGT0578717.1 phage repressor protein [Salmonella enterica]EGU0253830.1 phage repressor protein [Salmonella enterica]EHL3765477.1 phage repressor protein CI [Salmonella enterica subsp. enterica serovar Montevideo]
MNLEKGGRGAIERMVEAYGFKTRQALCDHLGISKSTLATRYMRDSFPAEWVIQCSLETGISLNWLTTGQGPKQGSHKANIKELEKHVLTSGSLHKDGSYVFDASFLPDNLKNPVVVIDGTSEFICDMDYEDVRDGMWVVSIDGEVALRSLTRLPGSRLRIDGGNSSFECAIADIEILAKVLVSCFR